MSAELSPAPSVEAADLLSRVQTIIERDGGLIEAYVPISLIGQEEVAVDEGHVAELAMSIQKESEEHHNLGQLTPVLLGEVSGSDEFHIIDGFHRVPALASLGKDTVYATIKPDCTWEDIVDLRIVTAKSHKSVKFSRIVEWVEDAWNRTDWSSRVNASSAFQMSFLKTNGSRQGITKDESEAIRAWVRRKSEQWGISPTAIDQYLRTARLADPELVKAARERKRGHKLEVVTPAHLREIVRYLPNQHKLQNKVADAATEHTLTVPEARALALAISKANDEETVDEYIHSRVWERMGAASKTLTRKRYKDIDPNRPEQYVSTLVDKFFDDQVAIAQLMIENAILTGAYQPHEQESSDRINTLLLTSDIETVEELGDIPEGELLPWEPEKVVEVAEKVLGLNSFMINFVNRKYGIGREDAEDIMSLASMRFLKRVNDGRLPQEYAEDLHLRKLLIKFVGYAAIDHIRTIRGRKGQKPFEVSIHEENDNGWSLEDTLGEDEPEFSMEGGSDHDFMKDVMPYLGEKERRILVLKGYFGLTSIEIAQILGTTEGTIPVSFANLKRKIVQLSERVQLEGVSPNGNGSASS